MRRRSRGMPIRKPFGMEPLPWNIIAPHERRARLNHAGQSLAELAQRGGLTASEALAILENRPFCSIDDAAAVWRLSNLVGNAK